MVKPAQAPEVAVMVAGGNMGPRGPRLMDACVLIEEGGTHDPELCQMPIM